MIDKLKKDYDEQWANNIRPPKLFLTGDELLAYRQECAILMRWPNYSKSKKLQKNDKFRDAKLIIK